MINPLFASIILPTYCERENIGPLVDALENSLCERGWISEIIVVDDNSPDGTAGVVQAHVPKAPVQVNCLVRKNERGLATAIRCGIENACGERIVVMDTDFNHDPNLIPHMIQSLDSYDIVIGSRYVGNGGMEDRLRHYLSWAYNLLLMAYLGTPVHDNLSGFYAMRREPLMKLDLKRIFTGYGDYFIRLLYFAKKQGCSMLEVPVFYRRRQHGSSKSDFVAMLRDYTKTAVELKRNF